MLLTTYTFKVRGQLRAEVYVADVPDDAWLAGVDSQGRFARRRAEAEGSAERFGDSDGDEEGPERVAARSSSKATGKRPLDEGASQREGQGSRLRTGGALNIGTEVGTRKRRRALLESDDDDDDGDRVPLCNIPPLQGRARLHLAAFIGHRLPSQTNTGLFCALCPHSCAPGKNFPVGHPSLNCSKPSTLNLRVLWRWASEKEVATC